MATNNIPPIKSPWTVLTPSNQVPSYTGGNITIAPPIPPITYTTTYTGAGGGGAANNYVIASANTTGPVWTSAMNSPGMTIKGVMEAEDVKIDGVSIKEMLQAIQDRLAILVPDPAKLEKFAALKASYEHYKLLEKLCTDNPPDDKV